MTSHVCAVCNGEAAALAHVNHDGGINWRVCDDPRCLSIARRWNGQGEAPATAYEREAMGAAGPAAGKHLVAGGETDMRKLSREAWADFVMLMIGTYRRELQRLAEEKAPPF